MRLKEQAKVTEHICDRVSVDIAHAVVVMGDSTGANGSREMKSTNPQMDRFRTLIAKPENQKFSGQHGKLALPRVNLSFAETSLTPEEICKIKSLIRKRRGAER